MSLTPIYHSWRSINRARAIWATRVNGPRSSATSSTTMPRSSSTCGSSVKAVVASSTANSVDLLLRSPDQRPSVFNRNSIKIETKSSRNRNYCAIHVTTRLRSQEVWEAVRPPMQPSIVWTGRAYQRATAVNYSGTLLAILALMNNNYRSKQWASQSPLNNTMKTKITLVPTLKTIMHN